MHVYEYIEKCKISVDNKQVEEEENDTGIVNELAHVKDENGRIDTPEITKDEGPEHEEKEKQYAHLFQYPHSGRIH